MNFSSRETTSSAPRHKLRIDPALWDELLQKLRERGGGVRESGAFLLGTAAGTVRVAHRIVLYDDLDTNCLHEGRVRFDGRRYGRLWELCAEASLSVVAEIHTHPFGPGQSDSDRAHPMISIPGHIALIAPNHAQESVAPKDVGVYLYRGRYRWTAYRGSRAANVLDIHKPRSKSSAQRRPG